jgi:hypothetical protein
MAKTGQAAATVTSGPSNAEALSTAGREADGATAVSSGGGGRWTGGGRAAGVTGSSGKSAGSVASSIRRGDEARGRPTTGTMTGRGVSTTTSGPEVVGVGVARRTRTGQPRRRTGKPMAYSRREVVVVAAAAADAAVVVTGVVVTGVVVTGVVVTGVVVTGVVFFASVVAGVVTTGGMPAVALGVAVVVVVVVAVAAGRRIGASVFLGVHRMRVVIFVDLDNGAAPRPKRRLMQGLWILKNGKGRKNSEYKVA